MLENEAVQRAWKRDVPNVSDLTVLMRVCNLPTSEKKFFEFDTLLSLDNCLAGKTIVEFPELLVINRAEKGNFSVVSSDEELKDLREMTIKAVADVIAQVPQEEASAEGEIAINDSDEAAIMKELGFVLSLDSGGAKS